MKDHIHLPLITPVYSTYHAQGSGSAIIKENPSIRNWYLNQIMILTCTRQFLGGYTTPRINIWQSLWNDNPYLEQKWFEFEFIKGYINPIIKELLNNGYYIYFLGVDDYYIEGKSLCGIRHYIHDGLICGYDRTQKTYDIYAYDDKWMYREFSISQKSFNEGRKSALSRGHYGHICGIKPKTEQVMFNPCKIILQIMEYLDSSFDKYPQSGDDRVFGIVVMDYMNIYVDKLAAGSIPHERMDWRIFRVIWEHKVIMLERLIKMEQLLNIDNTASTRYEAVVSESNAIRMLYAAYHMKPRNSVLAVIQKKLRVIRESEENILSEFVIDARRILKL